MSIFDQVESDEILLKEGLCYNSCSHSKLKFFLSLVQNSFRVHACAIFKMFASACVRSKKFRLRDEIINSGSFFKATAKVVNVEKTEAKSREVFASDLNPDYAQLSSALSDGHSAQLNYFFKNERNILTFIIARFRKIGRSGNWKI